MSAVGREVGRCRVVAAAPVPASGDWYRAAPDLDGVPVWVRWSAADRAEEDESAVAIAGERLRHLEHPAIPALLHLDPTGACLAVAAPEGVALARLIEARHDPAFALGPGTLLDIGVQLADALVHAHERGRPHGHLDPERIWITPAGGLVVWGFGAGPDTAPDPAWWAPERARGQRSSGDADQWVLAALLAALITGRVPWRGDDPLTEAKVGDASHLSGPVNEQWRPLGRLVERALSPEGRDRFPSVHPMRQALSALSQRVRQPTDLPDFATRLLARHPLPPAIDPEGGDDDAAEVQALDAAGFDAARPRDAVPRVATIEGFHDDEDGPPTVVSERPPPVDGGLSTPSAGPDGEARAAAAAPPQETSTAGPLTVDEASEHATDVGTSPTMVPRPGEGTEGYELPEPVRPPAVPLPGGAGASDVDDPTFGDIGVATRQGPDDDPPPELERPLLALKVAPVVVAALVTLLVVYALRVIL